ncbi:hypothetical protein QUB37_29880 [Microcoleus sp. AT3-A2]|uniref:hypothetical protein n=1 Tax=Microcoleus sp. AT3-A2 TaxID=2818610 RepID=UPI002FD491CA
MVEQAGKPVAENNAIGASKLISVGILPKPVEASFTNYKLPEINNLINPPHPIIKFWIKNCARCASEWISCAERNNPPDVSIPQQTIATGATYQFIRYIKQG